LVGLNVTGAHNAKRPAAYLTDICPTGVSTLWWNILFHNRPTAPPTSKSKTPSVAAPATRPTPRAGPAGYVDRLGRSA